MGWSDWADASGTGVSLIAGGSYVNVLVIEVQVYSITSIRVKTIGDTFPRKLQYAGSVELWSTDPDFSDTSVPIPNLTFPIQWEIQEMVMPANQLGNNYAYQFGWRLPLGLSAYIRVLS